VGLVTRIGWPSAAVAAGNNPIHIGLRGLVKRRIKQGCSLGTRDPHSLSVARGAACCRQSFSATRVQGLYASRREGPCGTGGAGTPVIAVARWPREPLVTRLTCRSGLPPAGTLRGFPARAARRPGQPPARRKGKPRIRR
jgi:hypothetical protein